MLQKKMCTLMRGLIAWFWVQSAWDVVPLMRVTTTAEHA